MNVVLLCGPAGSGKSTMARRLQAQGWSCVSFDEVAWERGHRDHPLTEAARAEVAAAVLAGVLDHVRAGRDVVVDSSFWSRAARDDYRHHLAGLGVVPEVWFLDTPRDVVLARVARRDHSGPSAITLSPETAAAYFDHFERPTADEGPLRVLTTGG